MNEKQTSDTTVRPTKKQRVLLSYIGQFITEHGYSPSYREIMTGLSYTSVATVALHVNSLIKRGHLRKRDHSARSLELIQPLEDTVKSNQVMPAEERWLVDKIEHGLTQAEQLGGVIEAAELERLAVLIEALRVLGFDSAALSFRPRLAALKQHGLPSKAAVHKR